MEIVYKKISELKPYKNNSRTHNKYQINQIVESIKEYGFTNPVLIDENNMIIAGHGRCMAGKQMGMKEVPCIVLSGLSDTQKQAYIIADNKLALNAGWNDELLKIELQNLKDKEFDLSLTGFDENELNKIFIEDLDIEDEEEKVEFTEILGEEHNYIVLYFDNEVDWLQAESLFNLKKVKAWPSKEGKLSKKMEIIGIGRVIKGREAIERILNENKH